MPTDLVCFSHLRWDFVYQRPQHLMSRFARRQRVFYFEEPVYGPEPHAWLETSQDSSQVWRVVPHLYQGLSRGEAQTLLQALLDNLFSLHAISAPTLWYYSPLFLEFTRHIQASRVVFDCMDELSAFKGAPPELKALEVELLHKADLVFTGGQSLYEAKKHSHPSVHCFPSSIDFTHFSQARRWLVEPDDQRLIPAPRLGFFGVIDERMDLGLLAAVAQARPGWHLALVGPVVKIDPASLPQLANIHYLGMKPYTELPGYLAGWDVALLPFALNESTRFISPTKTPEYLAGGKPVVSTPIKDVVRPYGELGLVRIAADAPAFIQAIESALRPEGHSPAWREQVDQFLQASSWDHTWREMSRLMSAKPARKLPARRQPAAAALNETPARS